MSQLTKQEAREIVGTFIKLREKAFKSKSKRLRAKYERAHSECVNKFRYLVDMKTLKYKRFSNYEDLRQEGMLGLTLALRSYDGKKGDFFWWAHKYIDTRISRAANRHSTIVIPMHQAKDMQPYKMPMMPTLVDLGVDGLQHVENLEKNKKIRAAINMLSADQKKAVELMYGLNGIKPHSLNTIAKAINKPREECIRLVEEARKILKPILEQLV